MIKKDCLYYEKSNDMGAIIDWCQNYPHLNFDCDKCERYIKKDFVRVVRCKDCRHKYYDGNQIICQKLYWCDGNNFEPSAEDFCSQGERREDADK